MCAPCAHVGASGGPILESKLGVPRSVVAALVLGVGRRSTRIQRTRPSRIAPSTRFGRGPGRRWSLVVELVSVLRACYRGACFRIIWRATLRRGRRNEGISGRDRSASIHNLQTYICAAIGSVRDNTRCASTSLLWVVRPRQPRHRKDRLAMCSTASKSDKATAIRQYSAG